jgi:hypothetical protein
MTKKSVELQNFSEVSFENEEETASSGSISWRWYTS